MPIGLGRPNRTDCGDSRKMQTDVRRLRLVELGLRLLEIVLEKDPSSTSSWKTYHTERKTWTFDRGIYFVKPFQAR